ncbi:MAG: phytoene desaturase family protein [Bacteroidia bacterium]
MQKVIVIGSGFSGLSAASFLAKQGYDVTVLEKHNTPGGRARQHKENGFTFDMGPSWYWMPDVFERYFAQFGKKPSDYYQLERLDPSYRVFWGKNDFTDLPANYNELRKLFESIEKGSAAKLDEFLAEAAYKYDAGINDLVHKPARSIMEFANFKVLSGLIKLDLLQSFHTHIRKFFKNPRLLQLIEFPVLFLGAVPQNTPALYSLMNYADIKLGTWYPVGGMYKVVEGMYQLALELGVKFEFNCDVQKLEVNDASVNAVITNKGVFVADVVVASADYHHVETKLLDKKYRSYSDDYWEKRVMAPSSLIYYVGLNKKISKVLHHTLVFDRPFDKHAKEIYETPQWPTEPLLYLSCTSQTDNTVAPEGHEALFILIPVAPGLNDSEEIREKYFNLAIDRLEENLGENLRDHIVYKRSYAHCNFINDYNSYKGNAYGLANTLMQTAFLKPSLKSKKVKNLFYTGQLTVPGPGVPPSLISGEVVAKELVKEISNIKTKNYATV